MKEVDERGEGGVILEFALRKVVAEHSERPMYLVLPALRIASSAGMDSVRGVSVFVSTYILKEGGKVD